MEDTSAKGRIPKALKKLNMAKQAITALNKKETVNTYTIGFKELNEFEYARMIADQYKTCHHEILMEKEDYMKQWDRLISFKDSPELLEEIEIAGKTILTSSICSSSQPQRTKYNIDNNG